ncbi:MAG: S9 family peptidase [Gemmatimonadota bacterium]|jgi:acylaminoacyl-peptidase
MRRVLILVFVSLSAAVARPLAAQIAGDRFEPEDVFQLEWAADPRISPDGHQIVFVRSGYDILTDRPTSALWMMNADGTDLRPLTAADRRAGSPRWSPDGKRLAFVSGGEDGSEIFVRWLDTGQEAMVTRVTESPSGLAWSPDGSRIAFSMFVPAQAAPAIATMPTMPDGADWGPAIKVVDRIDYRADGQGWLRRGHTHLFVVPADGGTPRQLTSGEFDEGGRLSWTPDGRGILFSANRNDPEGEPLNTEVFALSVADGALTQLTDRFGPDAGPVVSPDGRLVAYTGFDDRFQGYQVTKLYVMNRDGSGARVLTDGLDRDIQGATWAADGRGLFFQYDDEGDTNVAYVDLGGEVQDLAAHVGGLSLGRPYAGGQFSVARDGTFAFTLGTTDRPADVAVGRRGAEPRRLTHLNDDLFAAKALGAVEELWWESSFDGRRVQGWIVKPPDFDPAKKYPLLLEIHGGPFANYGDRFAAELQLYAAAGYVVLYTNPRGSTSYGEEFGNLIHHAYPGHDYDDLMSGVDAVIGRGYIDESELFVTGGSGGGVLSAWIVGKTDRFRAAVVQKPVINWYSFVLYADGPTFFWKYWFPGPPWENQDHYMARSPISLVGNVTTPTLLIGGEEDHRTPIPEIEQYYAALEIRGIPTAMVRIPDASHDIAAKPSNLIAKVEYVLGWFGRYRMKL